MDRGVTAVDPGDALEKGGLWWQVGGGLGAFFSAIWLYVRRRPQISPATAESLDQQVAALGVAIRELACATEELRDEVRKEGEASRATFRFEGQQTRSSFERVHQRIDQLMIGGGR